MPKNMIANTKLEALTNGEGRVGKEDVTAALNQGVQLLGLKSILLLLIVLELLPALINFARGMSSPFFSPAAINEHVYHHIHFLVYGFPIGLSVWIVMDRRVRELERQLAFYQPRASELKMRTRLRCWLPQTVLIVSFWIGWDDFKFHYVSQYWSLIHELLRILK